jgi:hypothetical protein
VSRLACIISAAQPPGCSANERRALQARELAEAPLCIQEYTASFVLHTSSHMTCRWRATALSGAQVAGHEEMGGAWGLGRGGKRERRTAHGAGRTAQGARRRAPRARGTGQSGTGGRPRGVAQCMWLEHRTWGPRRAACEGRAAQHAARRPHTCSSPSGQAPFKASWRLGSFGG